MAAFKKSRLSLKRDQGAPSSQLTDNSRTVVVVQGAAYTTWIYHLSRMTLTRFTYEPTGISAVWSPDSKRIAFFSGPRGKGGNFLEARGWQRHGRAWSRAKI